jgi:hypothetical protein
LNEVGKTSASCGVFGVIFTFVSGNFISPRKR